MFSILNIPIKKTRLLGLLLFLGDLLVILWGVNFIILFLLWRYIFYKISEKPMLPEKILLVGSDWSILEIIKEIKELPISSYDIIGVISDKNGNPQAQGFEGINMIGDRHDL